MQRETQQTELYSELEPRSKADDGRLHMIKTHFTEHAQIPVHGRFAGHFPSFWG